MIRLDATDKNVLIISDTHIPYSHIDYIKFLKRIKENLPDDTIYIHIGDEVDGHAWSFHKSDAELYSAGHELSRAIVEIQEGLHKLFPKLFLLDSNHGSLLSRKTKFHGLPMASLKPLNQLYETPRWEWHDEIILDTNKGPVYLCHGKSGAYGKLCKEMGMSTIQGHFHTKFELTYHESIGQKRFNMIIGCLADRDGLAMAYAKNLTVRFQLGCGYIDHFGTPHLIPMPLDDENRLI